MVSIYFLAKMCSFYSNDVHFIWLNMLFFVLWVTRIQTKTDSPSRKLKRINSLRKKKNLQTKKTHFKILSAKTKYTNTPNNNICSSLRQYVYFVFPLEYFRLVLVAAKFTFDFFTIELYIFFCQYLIAYLINCYLLIFLPVNFSVTKLKILIQSQQFWYEQKKYYFLINCLLSLLFWYHILFIKISYSVIHSIITPIKYPVYP